MTRSQLLGKVRVISPKWDRGNLSIESFVKNQNQTIAAGFDQTIWNPSNAIVQLIVSKLFLKQIVKTTLFIVLMEFYMSKYI